MSWDPRESITEADIEVILERAKELHPEAKPRMISDNGPQFIAKDFKEFIRISGMAHVGTSPYYPQSKKSSVGTNRSREGHPAGNAAVAGPCAESGGGYVEPYNNVRLNSAIGYITPRGMLAGRRQEIHAERDRK